MRARLFLLWLLSPCAFGAPPSSTYSTFLRAGFQPAAIAMDSTGNIYLAGSTTTGAGTNQRAALVVKLNPQGTQYLYVRTLGGTSSDAASAIAVDAAGNAYVTGSAASPDFPAVASKPNTVPGTPAGRRTFLTKLDPQGEVVFSEFLGGPDDNYGTALAVAANGDVIVSGIAGQGFPMTTGAFNAGGSASRPYLMQLDPSGAAVRFAAFGIGGNALTADATGNIYMAGATTLTDYPTTPGAYQPQFKQVFLCFGLCQNGFAGTNQYLTKVDPTGSKLLYSTAVAGGGQTTNTGLAIDAAGNAYLTGLAYGSYPYTVADPGAPQVRPFLTKIDAAGQTNVFSVPIGGAGVALDGHGNVYAGGSYNNFNLFAGLPNPLPRPGLPPGVVATPTVCQQNDLTTISQAYVTQADAGSGRILGTVLADGSNLAATAIVSNGTTVWVAGATSQADVPITPGMVVGAISTGGDAGAYLGLVNFSPTEILTGPQISCVLDAATDARLGPVAPNQILSLFGNGLGPATGVSATDFNTTQLGGVTVTFDSKPAKLLYVSATQINVAVPATVGGQASTVVQVQETGTSSNARQIPLLPMVPSLYAPLLALQTPCAVSGPGTTPSYGLVAVARNQDSSMNSCASPAKSGSVVSLFVNGLGGQLFSDGTFQAWSVGSQIPVLAKVGNWSAEVVGVAQENPLVWRVDVRVPSEAVSVGVEQAFVELSIDTASALVPVGPLSVEALGNPNVAQLNASIWVSQ